MKYSAKFKYFVRNTYISRELLYQIKGFSQNCPDLRPPFPTETLLEISHGINPLTKNLIYLENVSDKYLTFFVRELLKLSLQFEVLPNKLFHHKKI